jgi:hypothetical protein
MSSMVLGERAGCTETGGTHQIRVHGPHAILA